MRFCTRSATPFETGHPPELQGEQHVLAQRPPGQLGCPAGSRSSISGFSPRVRSPRKCTSPLLGGKSPARMFSRVLLPHTARPDDGHELPPRPRRGSRRSSRGRWSPARGTACRPAGWTKTPSRNHAPQGSSGRSVPRPGGAVDKSIVEGITPQPPLSGGLFFHPLVRGVFFHVLVGAVTALIRAFFLTPLSRGGRGVAFPVERGVPSTP